MSNDHEILADRLNAEPAIFKGCSSSELGMIVGLAMAAPQSVTGLVAGCHHHGFWYCRCRCGGHCGHSCDAVSAYQTRPA